MEEIEKGLDREVEKERRKRVPLRDTLMPFKVIIPHFYYTWSYFQAPKVIPPDFQHIWPMNMQLQHISILKHGR